MPDIDSIVPPSGISINGASTGAGSGNLDGTAPQPTSPRWSPSNDSEAAIRRQFHEQYHDFQLQVRRLEEEGRDHGYEGMGRRRDRERERAPSLGQLHQELEQEQEAQVNRLLALIRQQQNTIMHQQQSQSQSQPQGSEQQQQQHPFATTSTDSNPRPLPSPPPVPFIASTSASPSTSTQPRSPHPRSSFDLPHRASRSSRTPSRTTSPALRPLSASSSSRQDRAGEDFFLGSGAVPLSASSSNTASGSATVARDDAAFYQAEAVMLTRENQMLKQRIRELERQLSATLPASIPASATTSDPPDRSFETAGQQGVGGDR